MNFNKGLKLGLAFLLGASLFGCSSTPSNKTTDDDGMTNIDFWYSWTGAIAENNLELTELFNETVGKENNIKVTAEYQGTYVDLHSKLQSSFVAGEQPAVSVMEIASVKTFADAGIIQSLENSIRDDILKDFNQGLMGNSYVNDELYAVPYLRSTPILYYNASLFEQAGITEIPTNWEELAAASKKLETIGVTGFAFVNDVWHFEALTKGNGGNTVSDDELTAIFNEVAAVEAVQFLQDGIDNNNFKYISGENASDTLTAEVMNQKVGMWIGSTGSLGNNLSMAEENGFKINTAFIPAGESYSVPTGGCNFVMTSKLSDDEKKAAELFINFMCETEQTIYSHKKTGYLPATMSAAQSEEIQTLYKEMPQYQVALDQLAYGSGRPMNKGYTEAAKEYTTTLDKIFTTDADIQTELDAAASKATAILQQNK